MCIEYFYVCNSCQRPGSCFEKSASRRKKCSSDVLLGPVNSEKLYIISKLFELFSFL